MTNPDYRAMCAELVDIITAHANPDDAAVGYVAGVLTRARALLAQPEPEGPTDEEVMELMPQQMRDDLAAAARALAGFNTLKAAGAIRIILNRHAVDHARAALARWGRPTPQPVAVSERLPGPGDCIFPTGECWWFDPHADGAWYVDTFQGNYTHWLPANALPTPEATND